MEPWELFPMARKLSKFPPSHVLDLEITLGIGATLVTKNQPFEIEIITTPDREW